MKALIGAAVEPEHFHSQQLIRSFSSQYDIQSPCLETRIIGSPRLHQWDDRYLCTRYLSEDKWYQFATDIGKPPPDPSEGRGGKRKRGV